MRFYILVCLLLSACAPAHENVYEERDKSKLQEAQAFQDLFKGEQEYYSYLLGSDAAPLVAGANIPFNFGDLENTDKGIVLGICWVWDDGYREIMFNRTQWDTLNVDQKKALVYHEQAHCALGKNHKCSLLADGEPSIMYPSLIGEVNDVTKLDLFGKADMGDCS